LTTDEAHRLAREKGVSRPLYALVRLLLTPLFRVWFRMHVSGREHVPSEGAAIVAPNHKSFWDSFFIGIALRRHLRFMGKVELFEGRRGRLLVGLGAFPVRRGQADAEALTTAAAILADGGLLAIFPEGTRVRAAEELGQPRKGAGRLALESGAPLVPAAITGTDGLWVGPFPKPKRVQVTFGPPIPVAEMAATPEEAGHVVEEVLWPEVETQFTRLLTRPGVIAAALAALGVGGGVALQRRHAAARRSPYDPRRLASVVRTSVRRPRMRRRRARLPGRRRVTGGTAVARARRAVAGSRPGGTSAPAAAARRIARVRRGRAGRWRR
jgi:1-acyl-sn-glycerol-3-phosphate acyltransferase